MSHYPTTELQTIIMNALDSESAMLSHFPGGMFPLLPRAGSGPSATPNAFWTKEENALESGKLKNTIAVLDGGDVPAPNGAARGGYASYPLVYAYIKPDSSGDAALKSLETALFARFRRDISYPYHDVTGVQIIPLERQPLRDGEEFGYPDRQFIIWRLQVIRISLPAMIA
jgi:hypothetical protein